LQLLSVDFIEWSTAYSVTHRSAIPLDPSDKIPNIQLSVLSGGTLSIMIAIEDSTEGVNLFPHASRPGVYVFSFRFRFLLLLIFIIPVSCTDRPTDQSWEPVQLRMVELEATGAWIGLQIRAPLIFDSVNVFRDDQFLLHVGRRPIDTVSYDNSLAPSTRYRYHARAYQPFGGIDSTRMISVQTLDTTSHAIQFQLFALGETSSSILEDVFILNDSCAWAVGSIFMKDSTGHIDYEPYGIARWDGTGWTLKKVRSVSAGGGGFSFNLPPRGIWAFSENDVWLVAKSVFHWTGDTVIPYWIVSFPGNPNPILGPDQSAERVWGTSSSDVYVAGWSGAIAHFDGTTWQRIESGGSIDILDIWGVPSNQGKEVLCLASNGFSVDQQRKLLMISGQTVNETVVGGLPLNLRGIWFSSGRRRFVVGDGMYTITQPNELGTWTPMHQNVTRIYTNSIRGNASNDLFVAGHFGELLHFNGMTWMSYRSTTGLLDGLYERIAVKGNLVIAVGVEGSKAVIAVGKR
jgi:hypothetical protein